MSTIISVDSVLHDIKPTSVWSTKVIVATTIMLLSGTMNTLSFKLQNKENFKHGLFQTSLMFVGEWLNIIIFGLLMSSHKNFIQSSNEIQEASTIKGKNPKVSKLMIALPGLFDSIGSSLQVFPLLLVPASINQMLRGGVIIFTCIFSKIFQGRAVHRHHLLGVTSCIIGFVIVGYASIIESGGDNSGGASLAGTIAGLSMVICSLVIQGGQFVLEEMILTRNEIPPQRMVGLEGMFGLVFIFVWMMVFSYIPCPSSSMCSLVSGVEDPIAATMQVFSNPLLMLWCTVTILSIMLFNLNGLILTKCVSSMFRAFWDATRTILVWGFSLMFMLEPFVFEAFCLQIIGFVFQLFGNFVYNEIIELKCCGLNKNMQKYQNDNDKGYKKALNNGEQDTGINSNGNSLGVNKKYHDMANEADQLDTTFVHG